MESLDLSKEKLDIIVLAGQSNAQGNGKGDEKLHYKGNPLCYELTTKHPVCYIGANGIDGTQSFAFFYQQPNDYIFRELHEDFHDDDYQHGFYLSFADEYAKKYLKDGRKLIIVKAASGGTGFTDKMWIKGGYLYKRLQEMINMTLKLNPENRIVGFLWHQGECDAANKTPVKDYIKHFGRIVKYVRKVANADVPVITAGFVNEWASLPENKQNCLTYYKMFEDMKNIFTNYSFIHTEDLKSNNETVKNGDNIHFSRKSQIELGLRYFKEFEQLTK